MPSTTRPPPDEGERPSKRTKLSTDEKDAEVTQPANDEDEDDLEEEEDMQEPTEVRASDLYLDTINRAILDFDFEKVCSVSLTNINIYGCLVCGKYFQGRGRNSYAYSHSIHEDHHVFINLQTAQVYVLPDGYPVSDPSLDDISFVLAPSFSPASIANLSSPAHLAKPSYDLANKVYLPGYVGLNNIKRNDHMNVIIHSLLHIPPLRNYLLLSNLRGKESELLKRFAGLAKKLWNPRLFKGQVSPHEFLQEVNRASAGKFRLEQQGDPVEFLGWLLNRLHKDTGGTKRQSSSIIFTTFQGQLRVENQQVLLRSDAGEMKSPALISPEISHPRCPHFYSLQWISRHLRCSRIRGEKHHSPGQHSLRTRKIRRTDDSGICRSIKAIQMPAPPSVYNSHFKRFTKNAFVEEKNPTIVNFPLRGLDFRDYVDATPSSESTVYDLIANVTHESVAGTTRDKENTVWKAHLRAAGGGGENEKWFMIQDLIVEEARKEMIFLGETVLQIWDEDPMNPEGVWMSINKYIKCTPCYLAPSDTCKPRSHARNPRIFARIPK
ncbi:hypothetical protein K438DRAFT_1918145 [Mycena galopus ATCC 62051]|nr:hypothetical protein K438DRAFT_1918145 [Mycena galopus ATCC 62051]